MADLGRGEGQKPNGKKTPPRQSRSCRVCRLRKVKVGDCPFLSIFTFLRKLWVSFDNGKSNIRTA